MRIISGTARGCRLAEFSSSGIRPTADRVREALFSILTSRLGTLAGRNVLDLFAGTGAMGFEALSRGALSALFVDSSKHAIDLIRKNAAATRLLENAVIIQADARQIIARQSKKFDLVFIDPPYGEQDITEILLLMAEKKLLTSDGIICVETAHTTPLPEAIQRLVQADRRRYGSTSITFYHYGEIQDA